MEEAVGLLVLAPFRDIVSRGNDAIGNGEAGCHDGLVKAAQSLVKEGERALKRIEPLCLIKYEEYGSRFVDALKDDDEITQLIGDLINLLWDFEDYIDPNSFDTEKFTELQDLSKKVAPRIYHIILKMKLTPAHQDRDRESVSSSLALEGAVTIRSPSNDAIPKRTDSVPYPGVLPYPEDVPFPEDMEPEVKYATMPYHPGPLPDVEPRSANTPTGTPLSQVQKGNPPAPPLPFLDAWSDGFQRPGVSPENRRDTLRSSNSSIDISNNSDYNCFPEVPRHVRPLQPSVPGPPRSPNHIATIATTVHGLEQTLDQARARARARDSMSPISPMPNPRDSVGSSTAASVRSSVSDPRRERNSTFDIVSPLSHKAPSYPLGFQAQAQNHSQGQERSAHVEPLFARPNTSIAASPAEDGLEPVVHVPGVPDGLMPVVVESGAEPPAPPLDPAAQLGGCEITMDSSYYQFKGFCVGGMEVLQGGLGVKHIKKQGLATGNIEVAKCKSCAYELEWKAVQRDVNNEATENFKTAGIGFRLRFLSKSHIPTKNVGDQIYGCLFCVRLRRTTHPGDATIFFSQRQLFAHLARHPRPVPRIEGLVVVTTAEELSAHRNCYDLHLPSGPPREGLLAPAARLRELTGLPTATATQTCRPTPTSAMRRPPDGAEVLPVAAGARVLGVEFPERYQGEWCLGWVDHERGLLPAEAVRLDPPRRHGWDARGQRGGSLSGMRAVARWKFATKEGKDKDGTQWLSFGKGEVITNIICELSVYSVRSLFDSINSSSKPEGEPSTNRACPGNAGSHQDHWCWWGTNAKGKSGMFPRSHIEPGTLAEGATKSDRTSISSKEKRKGLLSRISIRYLNGGSWGEGGGGTSPQASIY